MRSTILATGLALVLAAHAPAASGANFFHSIKDKTFVKECGACHMPYPPSLLPARSWIKILGSLDKHFGEDASLPDKTRLGILDFLTTHAGDSGGKVDPWFMRGLTDTATPGRITDMPFWRSIHGGFPVSAFKRPNVRKRGNCIGCHG